MPAFTSTKKEVEFSLYAPQARKVSLAGQFNDWNTAATPMKKGKDGMWKIKMKVERGRCEYKYFVDGEWMQDGRCTSTAPNPYGTNNCVIDIQ